MSSGRLKFSLVSLSATKVWSIMSKTTDCACYARLHGWSQGVQSGDERVKHWKAIAEWEKGSGINAFLEASVWYSMLLSLGLSEALSPKCFKIAACRLLESVLGSPKELGFKHFSLEHEIR